MLSGMSQDNMFSVYIKQYAPQINFLKLINSPVDYNEVPPLLKLTSWHNHLEPYIGDTDKVTQLLELTQPPNNEICKAAPLHRTIEGYMKYAAYKGNNSMLGIRCMLMECPRITQNSDHWVPLQSRYMLVFFTSGHMQS